MSNNNVRHTGLGVSISGSVLLSAHLSTTTARPVTTSRTTPSTSSPHHPHHGDKDDKKRHVSEHERFVRAKTELERQHREKVNKVIDRTTSP